MDPCLVIFSAFCATVSVTSLWSPAHLDEVGFVTIATGTLLSALLFSKLNLYGSWRTRTYSEECEAVTTAWCSTFVVLIIMTYLAEPHFTLPRKWAGLWFTYGLIALVSYRAILKAGLIAARKQGRNLRSAVLISHGEGRRFLEDFLQGHPESGIFIFGCFDDRIQKLDRKAHPRSTFLGGYQEVSQFVEEKDIRQVWIHIGADGKDKLSQILEALRFTTAEIQLIPEFSKFSFLANNFYLMGGVPIVDLAHTPLRGLNALKKSTFDRATALFFLVALAPLFFLLALLIKTSSKGPIFFRQKRGGTNKLPFEVWKFRTMYIDTDGYGTSLQAQRNDPRVTPIGKILRRFSLDELPQLINVVLGNMSLVGPRPHPIDQEALYKSIEDQYIARHRIKPGITGLAQVNGLRGETRTEESIKKRIDYDLYYIQRWSFWLDIKILLRTPYACLFAKNAY